MKPSPKMIMTVTTILSLIYMLLEIGGLRPAGTWLQITLLLYIAGMIICEIIHPEKKK